MENKRVEIIFKQKKSFPPCDTWPFTMYTD